MGLQALIGDQQETLAALTSMLGFQFTTHELNWFDLDKRLQTKPKVGIIDFRGPRLRWSPDGRMKMAAQSHKGRFR